MKAKASKSKKAPPKSPPLQDNDASNITIRKSSRVFQSSSSTDSDGSNKLDKKKKEIAAKEKKGAKKDNVKKGKKTGN